MTQRWTPGHVGSLAPDASSLAAARSLGAGNWAETGHHASAVWGKCKGGGKNPYQTVVDLGGPAYTCSCPSRKFPCKHALSLLLVWAAGDVLEVGEPAEFAAQWVRDRAARVEKPPRKRSVGAANPVTIAQRTDRVSAGLEELDVWLTDQVRGGLAKTDKTFQEFSTIAARMVDAQAKGVAGLLRELPAVVARRADWPDRLLREYARLHLLVRAHRQLATLPAPLQATVRAHIGCPVPAEEVAAAPPVRDRWMVLGTTVTELDRLFTRKVWLRGRGSGSWALLLDFSFGSPSFASAVAAPGMLAEAELHYYPGAVPLRAQLGRRHGDWEPFTTLAGDSLDGALRSWAQALGADPWLRSWPVLLAGVTPAVTASGWLLVDAAGTALPVGGAEPPPWTLLGISGGHPVTVLAEWTRSGARPVAAFTAGEMQTL